MVSSSDDNSDPNSEKPCFINSIEEAMLPLQNCSSETSLTDQKVLSFSVSFNGWRQPNKKFKSWAIKMGALHKPIWQKAGIFEAVMSSTRRIHRNTDLVLGITEKWNPYTNTFVFPWGEATITLEDVLVLLGFSVLGLPYSASLDSLEKNKTKQKLEKEWRKIKNHKVKFVTQVLWMKRFINSDDDELEHVAFLVLWLSYFVFPSRNYHLRKYVLSVAVHLSRGTRIALAPTVLANLYRDLTLLRNHIKGFALATVTKLELTSLFSLVQVWTWERFKELGPEPNLMRESEPRMARWENSKHRYVKEVLENSKMDGFFEWRPYTKTVLNWKFPMFYPEEAMSVSVDANLDDEFIYFARCIKACNLVGIDSVEHYCPDRVVSQFGLLQDVPRRVKQNNNLSKEMAWDEYNKPIDDSTLYIPSRFATPCFTPTFCEWLRKSSAVEPLGQRNIIGNDDDDTCNSVSPKNMKRIQTEVTSDNDDEDDSLTVAQRMRLKRKKYNGRDASITADGNEETDETGYSADHPKVLPLSQVLMKSGEVFPERLKGYRNRTTTKSVRSELRKCGGSGSREVTLSELFQKDLSDHLRNKRACGYDDGDSCMDDNSDQNLASKDEEEETKILISANENNSSGPSPPHGLEAKLASDFVSPQEARETCEEVDEKKKSMVDEEAKKAECLVNEDGEKERSNKKKQVDDYEERFMKRKLAMEKMALSIEARIKKVEMTLAEIRDWTTRREEA